MKKKLLSVLLSAVLVFSSFTAIAAWDTDDNVLSLLNGLKIMQGDGSGNFRLDDYVSRAEFAKLVTASSSAKDMVATGLKISPFRDVKFTDWFAPYVHAAVTNGLCQGYIDGTFHPYDTVSYEEALTMLLRALGYTDEDFGVSWPYGQIGMAQSLEITKDVTSGIGEPLTRGQVSRLIYNTLDTKMKNSTQKLISIFDCQITEGVTIIASHNEDSSLGTDKIYTSIGILDTDNNFNSDLVGRHGDIVVKNGDDFVSFTPRDQYVEEHKVTNIIGKDLILDGQIYDINENTTAYFKSQALTYNTIASKANNGDTVRFIKNSNGSIDCLVLVQNQSAANIGNLDRYVIYSQLQNAVVCYKDGGFRQIDIKDTTTCYKDTQQSTYAAVKNEMEMGDILYVKMNGSTVDYVSYEKGSMEGPIQVGSSSWISQFPTNASTQYMRDGNKVSSSAILTNDIVYFCADLNMVLAYTDKVTGIYESASPTKDAPTSIKISGKEYKIESVAAFNALSSSGSCKIGDTITILLGRNGEIAGVASANSTVSSTIGYITGYGTKTFTDNLGKDYSGYYIKIAGTDGVESEYETSNNYSSYLGKVCRISFKDGKASVNNINSSGTNVSGVVSAANYTIGNSKLSENVRILDTLLSTTYEVSSFKRIYPQRLDGLNINNSKILYCEKNSAGEITDLILNDITGDARIYGIISDKQTGLESESYQIDFGTSTASYGYVRRLSVGTPIWAFVKNNQVQQITDLKSYSGNIDSLTHTTATINGTDYKLTDSVLVYKRNSFTDILRITLDEAINGNYRLNAYYDKPESDGGRIRVIIAYDK